jgi:hypothetical protein
MKRRIVMQNAQNTTLSNEYRSVPIGILVESATNPRKRFDEKNLEELAASMRAQRILAPLLVRELDESKYEVVAGARRLRAAKLAELASVRALRTRLRTACLLYLYERAWVGRAKARASTRAKWRFPSSASRSVLDNCLTPPTLSKRRFITS